MRAISSQDQDHSDNDDIIIAKDTQSASRSNVDGAAPSNVSRDNVAAKSLGTCLLYVRAWGAKQLVIVFPFSVVTHLPMRLGLILLMDILPTG